MEIKDIITYYDLSKLQKKHLQDMCVELGLIDTGLNDELALRVWDYITTNDDRTVLSKYENYLLASRGSTSWFLVEGKLDELKDKLNENIFNTVQYFNNSQISVEPEIFAATEPDENGKFFLRVALRDGNTSSFSMQGREVVPRIIQCTAFIDPNNNIIEVRSPAKYAKKIAQLIVTLIESESSLMNPLENFENDLGNFATALTGSIKESIDIPNQIVEEMSDEQISSIASILQSIDAALQTDDFLALEREIEDAKIILSRDFPETSFLSLILAGLGSVRLGASLEDLRSSPFYDSIYPFLDNQGGYIEFEINDQGVDTNCLIQVGITTRTINFSKFSSEEVFAKVRKTIFNL